MRPAYRKDRASATANALNVDDEHTLDIEDLKIKTVFIDGGPVMKRIHYGPRGSASTIRKRTSHITVVVATNLAWTWTGWRGRATYREVPTTGVDDVGQKTHPIGFRLGVIKTWQSNWYSDKNMAELLQEDLMIRRYVKSRLTRAGISKVEIERAPQKATITIHTARPGIVIGRKGAEVDKLRDELQHLTRKEIYINIQEIRRPELDAQLIGDSIARQIEQRISFRRAMKKSITAAMRMGAEGIKITCGGRLGGAEMSRSETFNDGRVPLHTLRADIDYARSTAHTTYGCIGIKVWICKGEIIKGEETQTGTGREATV